MKQVKKLESLKKMQLKSYKIKGGITIYDYEMDSHNTTVHSATHNGSQDWGNPRNNNPHVTCDHREISDGVNNG